MKIKNQAAQQNHRSKRTNKNNFANKENTTQNEYQVPSKQMLRSKSTFGDDITKQSNQTTLSVSRKTTKCVDIHIELPAFLKKSSGIDIQASPYEEQILSYIINNWFPIKYNYGQKGSKKSLKRKYVVQKFYNIYKKFRLRRQTLYLAVYYFDNFLIKYPQRESSRIEISADACMFIAMKYEQIYPPSLSQWANGKEKAIIGMQAKILQVFDFALAVTTPQHFLEYYQGKNLSMSKQEKKLHELVLDLYLFTGQVYRRHPLEIVQEILESFRSTSHLEHNTNYEQSDYNVKDLIQSNYMVWEFLIQTDIYFKKK